MNEKTTMPLVCAIVLNYNGQEHLQYSLPAMLATEYERFHIIVVDNASSDGSVDYIRQFYPQVTLLTSPVNRGWSGGNNLGIIYARELGAEYVVLANNDIRNDRRWISAAVSVAQQDPRIGIVGFRIFEAGGTNLDVGFMQAVAEWAGLQVSEPQWVDGMAMFIRMSLFDKIGLIDEAFFAYAEDNDFERRARKAGYRVVTTNVPVWHHGQGTFGRMPLRAATLQIRNNLRLSLKHDSLSGILYQVTRHFAKGCLPFVKVDRRDPVIRRMRPSNVVVNFAILLYAIIWNLYHLPETLRRRREDTRRALSARRSLGLV